MAIPWLAEQLKVLRHEGLLRDWKSIKPLPEGWCEWNGRRLRNFAGNDYLNLATDPRVIAASETATRQAGTGSTASALVSGRTPWHAELEERLADWLSAERAMLFPTGFAANMGTISALIGRRGVIFSDELNHASLIDGCRLSGAKIVVYPHRDLAALQDLMPQNPADRRMLVTDSLFSMDGDCAPLTELVTLCQNERVPFLIDEAHALGTCGQRGGGLAEELGLQSQIDVRIGTLSKAIGALGGFAVGSRDLVDWLWNRARAHIFSTALPPGVCAAASKSIEILQSEPQRRIKLDQLSEQLRTGLKKLGLKISSAERGPIVPVILDTPQRAVRIGSQLAELGFLVGTIRPPSVPPGTSRLRITLSSAFEPVDVEKLLAALGELCR